MAEVSKRSLSSNGLFGSREFLKNDYMRRDIGAEKGLYGNSIEEAWYGGYLGDGKALSKIHILFAKDQLPPAKFFWSMTLYTCPTGSSTTIGSTGTPSATGRRVSGTTPTAG